MTRIRGWHRILLVTIIAGLLLYLAINSDPTGESDGKDQLIKKLNLIPSEQSESSIDYKLSKLIQSQDRKWANQARSYDTQSTNQRSYDSKLTNQGKSHDSKSTNEETTVENGRESPFDHKLELKEQYNWDFNWGGSLFNDKGKLLRIYENVTSCLIHSFSPYIERETAKRFVDPPHDQVFFANSPAVKWHNGELVLVARMWLDRERYEPKNSWPPNHFADNWLYTEKYNDKLAPVSSGSIMGIPLPKQWWVGDGPIEPRLFRVQDRLFISFNAAMSFTAKQAMDFTIMYDYDRNIPLIPKIKGGTPMMNATEKNDMPRDKHWMALIHNDELYFVHNLDPLRVMHCTLEGDCKFVHDERDRDGFIFEHHISHLRGGTPFEQYRDEYYISIAHSTMYKRSNHHRYYTAHLVVLYARPSTSEYRIAYVSDNIKIHKKIYASAPMVRPRWIEDDFFFPVGLLVESPDDIVIGGHLNDFSSVLIRIKGMEKLMKKVITEDRLRNGNLQQGPPIGYLHQYIHDIMENLTDYKFVH